MLYNLSIKKFIVFMFYFYPKKDFKYLGYFWTQEHKKDENFCGHLVYSQDSGFYLEIINKNIRGNNYFFLPDLVNAENGKECISKFRCIKTIFGYCPELSKIILINCTSTETVTPLILKLIFKIEYAIVVNEYNCLESKLYSGFYFHFPELDSFCIDYLPDDYVIFDEVPIVEGILDDNFKIEITQYPLLNNNISLSEYLYYAHKDDNQLLKELREKTKGMFLTKKFYTIFIEGKENSIKEYIEIRHKILMLFSIFLIEPIYSDFAYLIDNKKIIYL